MERKQLTNRLKKLIYSLILKRDREENKLFTVEGVKLCKELLESNFKTEFVVVKEGENQELEHIAVQLSKLGAELFYSSEKQFKQISDTVTPQGILAVVKFPEIKQEILGNFIMLDGIADPGNFGTIIRTADWFGLRNIVIGNGTADHFSPKVIRSTMGSIFRCNIFQPNDLVEFLSPLSERYEIYGAILEGSVKLEECKPVKNFGLVFGSEPRGISPDVKKLISKEFIITGIGKAESLNVAVAAGISMFHFSKFQYNS